MTKFDYNEIQKGDLVDFGHYGKMYVCNPNYSEESFWITDIKEDRDNNCARGWSIRKNYAKSIIESFLDNEETLCPNCKNLITPITTEYEEGSEGFKTGKLCPICEEYIY